MASEQPKQNDGGPAFSRPCVGSDQAGTVDFGAEGMSLRDYFAAKAMAAMLSIEDVHHNAGESEIARWAYEQADAMLEARNQ